VKYTIFTDNILEVQRYMTMSDVDRHIMIPRLSRTHFFNLFAVLVDIFIWITNGNGM